MIFYYPNEQFWQIAAEEGCTAILGCDAYSPQHVVDPKSEQRALTLVECLGLECRSSMDGSYIESKIYAASS